MGLVLSKYTYVFEYNSEHLLFNSETRGFLKLGTELYHKLKNKQHIENDIDNETLEYLIKNRIIVKEESQYDYYYEKKMLSNIESYSNTLLSLILVPTSECNFDCPYCFEKDKKSIKMSDQIIDDLLLFIHQHDSAKVLDLTWYGGEPLLAFDRIKKIREKIDVEVNIRLRNHELITNGYLVTNEVLDFFSRYPLTFVQVTLDGNRDTHNKKRKVKESNAATFDIILNNIDKMFITWPSTIFAIRINIDKSNLDDFVLMRKYISERWRSPRIYAYPGFLRDDEEGCLRTNCTTLQYSDMQNFYFTLAEKDVDVQFFPHKVKSGCTMNTLNSYIVGPVGEIYKCWNEVGNTSKIVAYINKKEITNLPLLAKYMTISSNIEDLKCKQCGLFPICSGGCCQRRIENLFENKSHILCSLYKRHNALTKALSLYYERTQSNIEQANKGVLFG